MAFQPIFGSAYVYIYEEAKRNYHLLNLAIAEKDDEKIQAYSIFLTVLSEGLRRHGYAIKLRTLDDGREIIDLD